MTNLTASQLVETHVTARSPVRSLLGTIGYWMERSRQRAALAELEDHVLDDIGVSRDAAARESAKPFWR